MDHKSIIAQIMEEIQATEHLKDHILEIHEDIEYDGVTLVLKNLHDVITISEFTKLISHYICDHIMGNDKYQLTVRLF